MDANFLCPHCRAFLNVGGKIVIAAKNEAGKRGILLFSLHLGDYEIVKHDLFEMEVDEKLALSCPACHKSLKAPEVHKNIYKILMQDDEDQEHQILFSGVYGEKCTYKVRDKVVESYGEHAAKYLDFTSLCDLK